MNRSTSSRESLIGGRNIPTASHHRRGRSLTRAPRDADDNLDLFSKNRRTLSIASSDESDVSLKFGGGSAGSAKAARNGIDDLLLSSDGGKNDYDWLLTPPETPQFPSSDAGESKRPSAAPRSSSLVRSASTTKSSRLSVSQSESSHTSRPARSNSVNRPSISGAQYSSYSSTRLSSILNTSSASVSSYITRPSSPMTRSPSTARHSVPSARPTTSRPSTPSKVRQVSNSSSIEKTCPAQTSRPTTPSSRPLMQPNSNLPTVRPSSRPSTPTRRNPAPSHSPAASLSTSAGRALSNGRSTAPSSRQSSPSPRIRPSQPVVLPDFPVDTPPNLRTTLPDRPLSAGRSRPGVAVTVKGNTESTGPSNLARRHSSPIFSRGRLVEPAARGRTYSNGHVDSSESRNAPSVSEMGMRKPIKASATTTDSTGFGRTISKKSLDMAIRHMDIRSSTGSTRPLSGTTLFPQSIRSATPKTQVIHAVNGPPSFKSNSSPPISSNGAFSENGNCYCRSPERESEPDNGRYSAKLSGMDIFGSSRYDGILLKEDLKSTNWLHSMDDKSDQGPIFDNGLDALPEPFGLL